MHRRTFISTTIAAIGTIRGTSLLAHDTIIPDYDLPEALQPRTLRIRNDLAPYEIHVDPGAFALYWTLPKRQAIRYPVGIGRRGLYEAGEFYVGAKREWPSWTPTPAMIDRNPAAYERFADGVPGGLSNPLGARALYLYQEGRGDTYLRIHGTNDPGSLGRRVSNGCARMINDQVVKLYEKVPLGTRVVLYPAA